MFDEIACMTRGGLTLEDLFLDDNGVIRSVKQCESLKKNQNNLVKKDKKVSKVVVEESDDSEVNDNSDPGEDVSISEQITCVSAKAKWLMECSRFLKDISLFFNISVLLFKKIKSDSCFCCFSFEISFKSNSRSRS